MFEYDTNLGDAPDARALCGEIFQIYVTFMGPDAAVDATPVEQPQAPDLGGDK